MIALNASTRSLQLVLAGAKNTSDCKGVASFSDIPARPLAGNVQVDGSTPFTTTGVTAVTIMAAPAISPDYTRRLRSLNFNNLDAVATTVTVLYNDNGTTYNIFTCILQTLETLCYEEGFGFWTLDVNGAQKSQAANTSSATSTAQAAGSQASSMASIALLGSSQASSLASGIVIASLNSVSVNTSTALLGSSQASSLASGIVLASLNSVSSQASSMAALTPASVSSQASLAALTSTQISGASSLSFTSTTWSTISSGVSRVKSSFTW